MTAHLFAIKIAGISHLIGMGAICPATRQAAVVWRADPDAVVDRSASGIDWGELRREHGAAGRPVPAASVTTLLCGRIAEAIVLDVSALPGHQVTGALTLEEFGELLRGLLLASDPVRAGDSARSSHD
jgi:hypothetical protein